MRYYRTMVNDSDIWLERLSSLHRNLMRKAANEEHLQLVHIEILQYLSLSNRYSNTAQALTDYLGQTKGSISQSLKFLEDQELIDRKPCEADKRVTRLYLTDKSISIIKRVSKTLFPDLPDDKKSSETLKNILHSWQKQSGMKGFGQCRTCRFHEALDNNRFRCGLTGEPLKKTEIHQICREHEFEAV